MIATFFRRWGIAALLLCALHNAQAGLNLAQTLPIGPQVVVGQLDNGLTYYIQKNSRPEKRLELRLVVKAGSILEDDDQLGLAHFTEHMAFNGSTHFKKHELVSYLQSIGLKFGADLNAYTGFDETVYILPLPTDQREAIEKGFLVLQDWAQGVSFHAPDIDLERAIVLEELRLGKGAQDRMNQVLYPRVFEGSLYAKRLPIGTESSLKEFSHDAIRRFYKDWYRPNLMAVVVVGDIEPQDAKALVETYFGPLKNPDNARPRVYAKLPVRSHSEAVVVTDKEATSNQVAILYPVRPDPVVRTLADYRQALVEHLVDDMLGMRLAELTQQARPPFVEGESATDKAVPGYRWFGTSAQLGRQGADAAVQALVRENARAQRFGFGAAELQRSKLNLLRGREQHFAERDKTDSATYAEEYLRHFLQQETIPGIANERDYTRRLLPTITRQDVNRHARHALTDGGARLVMYTGSDHADGGIPTPARLLELSRPAGPTTLRAAPKPVVHGSLLPALPKGGRILAERAHPALGLTELDLSNGVKVILKPTDFKNDEVLLAANRFGGQSLYGQADMFNAGYASQVVASMGAGRFSPLGLQEVLAGKVVAVHTGLLPWMDTVQASSGRQDLETLLQMVTLRFGPPREDRDLYQSFISRSQDAARHSMAHPESRFTNAVQTALFNAHPRVALTPTPADFERVSLERAKAIYQERFSSAWGLTFILVGSFSLDAARPLIARYLASLPTHELPAQSVDLGIRPVTGVVRQEVHAGREAKSTVSITFTGDADYSEAEHLRLQALVEVLNIKLIDELRERLTLIYGGGMGGSMARTPYPHYQLGLVLPCAPENVDRVVEAALGEIRKLQDDGVSEADLAKVKQNWHTTHRKSLRENSYWLGRLQSATLYGTDPTTLLDYDRQVDAIAVTDIQAAARRYLRRDNYVQVVLRPEK